MWITLGIYAIALQQGIFQVLETKEFPNPEDCFREALIVAQDTSDPRGMLCVPVKKEGS
jgi:hypothetical protein